MKATYASSQEISAAQAAQDDGETLTARQAQIMRAAQADCLHVHDERAPREMSYAGGGYNIDSRGNYRERFYS